MVDGNLRKRSTASGLLLFFLAGASRGDPELMTAIRRLEERCAIVVVREQHAFPVRTFHGLITGANASPDDVERYASLFVQEFDLYPASLIRKVELRRVVLCKDLAFAGQRRAAIPDFEHHTLYLDVLRGRDQGDYQSHVIHHEFFHMIDYKDDGVLYGDERWSALNPPDFRYGPGGRHVQHVPGVGRIDERTPGFINAYARSGVEEDKAETFAFLMVRPDYLRDRTLRDPILEAKCDSIRRLLKRFCPAADLAFWKRVEAARAPASPRNRRTRAAEAEPPPPSHRSLKRS